MKPPSFLSIWIHEQKGTRYEAAHGHACRLLPSSSGCGLTRSRRPLPRRATPNSKIPTVSLANVARHGFYYAGGKYVGELGDDKESTMGGAMYVEVMVPKQIRSPYPVVFFHGAGQTGVDWLQTPGRPAGLGLQLPRHGLRRLPPGFSDARPFAVRARRRRHAGSVEPEHPDREQPRRDLHGRRGARRFPAGEEAQPVARHRPHRRQGLRRLQQDAGAVPRAATARRR